MLAQLIPWIRQQGRRLASFLAIVLGLLARGLLAGWRLVRPTLVFALNVLVALLLLFEEWGWHPLSNLLAQLARFRIWALAELWIAGLPPYGALLALGIPTAILVPAKLFGVYLLALGHVATAALVLVAAKLASTALIARVFILTKPALMQIAWFKRGYEIFVPWQEALFQWIRSTWVWRYGRVVKWRAAGAVRRLWRSLRPRIAASWARLKPRAMAFARRLRSRTSLAGGRLLRRLQGPEF